METIDDLISYARDARETKRALSVTMGQKGTPPREISQLVNVSEQYVSKWKGVYEREAVAGLHLGHEGKKAKLRPEERAAVVAWVEEHQTIERAVVRD